MKKWYALVEHIKTEKIPKHHWEPKPLASRDYFLLVMLFMVMILLIFKLISLQIFNGSYYRSLSDSNRIRTKIIHAPRGIILDRNKTPLVLNQPGFRKIIGTKTILLNREDALRRIANGEKGIEIDSLRYYPFKEITSHVLGYVGQISKEQLKDPNFSSYNLTDFVGKTGIELYYEKLLRGIDGKQLVEVDAMGKPTRVLGQTEPISGQDLTLTLDIKLQQKAYEALERHTKGVVIVSNLEGEILALVSKPSFDPNLFTLDETYKTASQSSYTTVSGILEDNKNQPLLNRAIGGVYPPGSTFKLITAAAGLDEKIIDKNFKVVDTGVVKIGNFSYANWYFTQYGKKDSDLNIIKAISRSNDIFFYKLAELVGVNKLARKASQFGIGKRLGIDLLGEESGVLPTEEWKEKNLHEQWYLGDTYHYGIGQGFLLTTPLQVNAFTVALANGGTLYKPHLLLANKPTILANNIVKKESLELIRQGMIDSCSPGGVAYPLFNFKVKNRKLKIDGKNILPIKDASRSALTSDHAEITVACKTGTAQHHEQNLDENILPHAWITLYAPAYDPEIVVTVLIESSGEGSSVAAPVAKKILEEWFER